ncbi:hypothetical protein Tco_1062436, partial [Tanacetum coccineum]
MESETLRQIYVPKWNVIHESALDDPDMCRTLVDQLAPLVLFFQLRGMDYDQLFMDFNVGAARQTCLGGEVRMQTEYIFGENKKLEEAEAAEAIRLRGQVATVKATAATRVNELNGLKERNSALEEEKNALKHKVAALESTDAAKVTELT